MYSYMICIKNASKCPKKWPKNDQNVTLKTHLRSSITKTLMKSEKFDFRWERSWNLDLSRLRRGFWRSSKSQQFLKIEWVFRSFQVRDIGKTIIENIKNEKSEKMRFFVFFGQKWVKKVFRSFRGFYEIARKYLYLKPLW